MCRKLICLAVSLISVVLGGYYDSGMQLFTQPNGVTFQARIYGDGAEAHFRTSDGYEILKGTGEYYYYAILDSSENIFTQSEFKVGIDFPPSRSYELEYIENIYCTKSTSRGSVNGNYKIGIVLVEFSDKKHYVDSSGNGYTKDDFENMMFSYDGSWNTAETGATNPEGREVFGSLKEYYEFQTNGHVTIDTASCVILTPNGDLWHELNDSFYNYSLNGIIVELNLGGPFYSDYDKICIIHAGDTEYGTALSPRAYCPGRYWIAGERHQYWYGVQAFTHIGIHAHEFGHTLGLNHTGGRYWNTELMDSTAKYWDVMLCGNVNGPYKDAACPAGINPVYKLWHGWIDESDTVHITHSVTNLSIEYNYNSPKYYIVNRNHGTNGGEYFILENRQREGWDEYTPIKPDYPAQPDDANGNEGGLLILRVKDLYDDVIWATNINANNVFADFYCGTNYSLYQYNYCRAPFPLFQGQSINDYSTPNTNFYNTTSSSIISERNSDYAFHNIIWDNNTKIVTLDVYTDTWSGNITSNTVWTGKILVLDNITIGSGVTLTIESGTTVKFASGKYLYVNSGGNLTANGATFTKSGSSSWGGIRYNSGSTGSLTNCTIANATYGVYLNGSNRTIQGCTITNAIYGVYVNYADPTIENCTISASTGIYNYYSDPTITDNVITAGYGIENYYSSPEVYGNNINGTTFGLYCVNNSSPVLSSIFEGNGNNYFHSEYILYGVYTQNNSNPVLGFAVCEMIYGRNSFVYEYPEMDAIVHAGTNCSINAKLNYWGTSSPTSSLFDGNIDWNPYLTSMPVYNSTAPLPENSVYDTQMMLAKSAVGSSEDLTKYYDKSWSLDKKIEFIRYLYIIGEAMGVTNLCKDIISEYSNTPEAFVVLDMIYQISKNGKIKKDFDQDMLKIYLKTFKDAKDSDLKANALMILAGVEKDISLMDEVYKSYKNNDMGKYALHQKFMYYFHEEENRELARAVLNEMDKVYLNEVETYKAHILMGDEVMNPQEFYSQYFRKDSPEQVQLTSTDIVEIIIPEKYELKSAYPNPFNPSTTLEYALPVHSEVKCSIYDVRGNLVKEYSFNQNAGTYSIVWDALNVSSGIYLIRFTAESKDGSESFVDYQKVTLLK